MRHVLCFVLALGCATACPAPGPSTTPTTVATATSGSMSIRLAVSAASGCPSVAEAIVGTWETSGLREEYRADGTYFLNDQPGHITWLGPGHAFLAAGNTLHHEYWLGLTDVNELVAVSPTRATTVYRRASPTPPFPTTCWDIHEEIVGTWIGGEYAETYGADGSYAVNAHVGTWRLESNGHLFLDTDTGTGRYYFAILSDRHAIAFGESQPGTIYARVR